MIKLSIIIPVYNVEEYISRCVLSCLEQDLVAEDYEIIVVNDGSLDHSIDNVKSVIAQRHCSNVRIINRNNGGLSAARNTGLFEARGNYVWFVDGDDWIEPNVIKKLTSIAIQDELDVLCFGFQLVFPDGHHLERRIKYRESGRVYRGFDFIVNVVMPPAAWLALFRRDYLIKQKLQFMEDIIHEDQEFTPRAYCLADRIAFHDCLVYNYNQREGGIMKSKQRERRCKDLLIVADSLYEFAESNTKGLLPAYWEIINKVSFAFSQSLANYQGSYANLGEYKLKPYFPLSINPLLQKKDKWKYKMMNSSLRFYLIVYRLRCILCGLFEKKDS